MKSIFSRLNRPVTYEDVYGRTGLGTEHLEEILREAFKYGFVTCYDCINNNLYLSEAPEYFIKEEDL